MRSVARRRPGPACPRRPVRDAGRRHAAGALRQGDRGRHQPAGRRSGARRSPPQAPLAVLSGPTFAHEVAAGQAHRRHPGLRGRGAARTPGRAAWRGLPSAPMARPTWVGGGDRRGGQERPRHRLRGGGGRRAGPQRPRRADRPGLCRDDALRPGPRRPGRDAHRPVGPGRPRPHLLLHQLAQLLARGRARPGRSWPPS